MTTHETNLTHDLQALPDYDISAEALADGQQQLVAKAYEQFGEREDLFAIWIRPSHPLANVVRTLEKQTFPEIEDVMDGYEDQSMFLAVVDTRDNANRIAHAFRISGASLDTSGSVVANAEFSEGRTNIVLIDDIIQSEQGLSSQDFEDYYKNKGMDLSKCLSVETNWRVGEKSPKYNDLPLSQIGYLSLFKLIEARGVTDGEAAVFAHLNSDAIHSLQATGIEYEPIAGRADLKTPTVEPDGSRSFDDHYQPVCIPATPTNLGVFEQLSAFAAPQMYL